MPMFNLIQGRDLAPHGGRVVFLGEISDEDKAAMLASATCYIAPQTGGESFGIVLVEAMAAGTRVIASGRGRAEPSR